MVALFAHQSNIVEFPQKSNEWYTPARYVEAAREVMGSIDLDPASCELANRTVKATRYYTKEDDGLVKPWHGHVWLNPPYGTVTGHQWAGKSNISLFVHRLLAEYEDGNIEQAILLTRGDVGARWFWLLWDYVICFACEDPYFERPDRESTRHRFGTSFTYLGPHEQKFIDIFSQFGTVARRVSVPKVQPTHLSLWEVN